ncbi:MAG: hypothetical protein M1829_002283 [Trizodia sp. TS-e1964]|nr:MAG: hypothetical protein M1829_002283 [Trizodia sp. TS-e1964]
MNTRTGFLRDYIQFECSKSSQRLEIVYLASAYYNRIFSNPQVVTLDQSYIIFLVCLWIAEKQTQETTVKMAHHFAHAFMYGGFNKKDILQYEIMVLQALEYRISAVTPLSMVEWMLEPKDREMPNMVMLYHFLDVGVLCDCFIAYLPQVIATAALCLARAIIRVLFSCGTLAFAPEVMHELSNLVVGDTTLERPRELVSFVLECIDRMSKYLPFHLVMDDRLPLQLTGITPKALLSNVEEELLKTLGKREMREYLKRVSTPLPLLEGSNSRSPRVDFFEIEAARRIAIAKISPEKERKEPGCYYTKGLDRELFEQLENTISRYKMIPGERSWLNGDMTLLEMLKKAKLQRALETSSAKRIWSKRKADKDEREEETSSQPSLKRSRRVPKSAMSAEPAKSDKILKAAKVVKAGKPKRPTKPTKEPKLLMSQNTKAPKAVDTTKKPKVPKELKAVARRNTGVKKGADVKAAGLQTQVVLGTEQL